MAQDTTPLVFNLPSSLTTDRAAALKDELGEALATSNIVHLHFSEVEELGLACLQVIYAARASARTKGKRLVFVGLPSERAMKRLRASGFLGGGKDEIESLESALVDA